MEYWMNMWLSNLLKKLIQTYPKNIERNTECHSSLTGSKSLAHYTHLNNHAAPVLYLNPSTKIIILTYYYKFYDEDGECTKVSALNTWILKVGLSELKAIWVKLRVDGRELKHTIRSFFSKEWKLIKHLVMMFHWFHFYGCLLII